MKQMKNCRHFSGYKPCGLSDECHKDCVSYNPVQTRVLVVHLEALGSVLRATSLLPAIHRKWPHCHVTWVTQRPAEQMLKPLKSIDRVLTLEIEDLLTLKALEFDVALVIDKSQKASGVVQWTHAKEVRGFKVDASTGAIVPASSSADDLWELGLNDHKKFFENQKAETQLLVEALDLGSFQRDPYQTDWTEAEQQKIQERNKLWRGKKSAVIGLNTGCADVIPYKKWTVSYWRELVCAIQKKFDAQVVLLGGPEDELRNFEIAEGLNVITSPQRLGLRNGMLSVAACDVVVTGDSLGMHMAIAAQVWTVAWFGPTCAQEIDLYDRGVHLKANIPCSPCWKRKCQNEVMCYDQVAINDVLIAIEKSQKCRTLSFKPRFLEISP